jgi:beta-mannosidase
MSARALTVNDLNEGWTLTHTGGEAPDAVAGKTVPAEVPGTTHTALLAAGLIPDPYLSDNEAALQWMWRTSWRYDLTFAATPAGPGERIDLVFDGLDTVATVALNGVELGETFNMNRSYRFDAREALAAGANKVTVDFGSALEYAFEREAVIGDRPRPQPSAELRAEAARQGLIDGDPDEILAKGRVYPQPFNAIRKMACSFGWDWGPDLQTAGIWKPVRLERWRIARFAAVRPLVTVEGDKGVVTVHAIVERSGSPDADEPLRVIARVGDHTAEASIAPGENKASFRLDVPNPELWWPAGHGEAHLHSLTVELHTEDELLDTFARRIGFRTVTVDQTGGRFTFVVNGRPIFVKGANWIPDDHLMTRITPERLERRIDQALGAHLNLLRIWGGGIYETDDFYDVCDERGVMVWQDFLMACAGYSEDEVLWAEVEAEARENVTRLAPHASLVLYNGSNENVWGWWDWGWREVAEYTGITDWGQRYYEELFPAVLAELDPTRPYTPSSPFSTHPYQDDIHPNSPAQGTVHEWEVWNRKDYTHYRDYVPPFCSEFGFQGPATWATMQRALPPEAFDQDSPIWLLHQKADDGNGKLNRGFEPHLPGSEDFEMWHWITSLNQARAIRFGIEHYRSWWPECAGSIVWQLNDCWPVTSWAAIDGDERLKPLYFALRAAYEPRLLTFQPRGADGGLDPAGEVALVAVNDTDEPWSETLTFTRLSLDGTELAVATAHLQVGARSAATLEVPAHVRTPQDAAREILTADAGYPGDVEHVRGVWTFAEDKDIAYEPEPFAASGIAVDGGYDVTVRATSFVRDLSLLADKVDPDAVVSDGLVTLLPGETHVFHVRSGARVESNRFTERGVLVSVNAIGLGSFQGAPKP